jgi:hypothetical protein
MAQRYNTAQPSGTARAIASVPTRPKMSGGPAIGPPPRRGVDVLVLVRDALGAGLMGALVEAEGWGAAFPFAGERADVAVQRLRPAAVLADGYHAAVRSHAFHDELRRQGSRLIVFAPAAPWRDLQLLLRDNPHATLVAPARGESLAALIRSALTGGD